MYVENKKSQKYCGKGFTNGLVWTIIIDDSESQCVP